MKKGLPLFGYCIMILMGLTGFAAEKSVSGSFVTVCAEAQELTRVGEEDFRGVSADRRSISYKIKPKKGWKLVSPKGGKIIAVPGQVAIYAVTSLMGEDSGGGEIFTHDHFPFASADTHIFPPGITAACSLFSSGPWMSPTITEMSLDISGWIIGPTSNGLHRIIKTYMACPVAGCMAVPPAPEISDKPTYPTDFTWTWGILGASPAGGVTNAPALFAKTQIAQLGTYNLSADVVGRYPSCEACTCGATTNATCTPGKYFIRSNVASYNKVCKVPAGESVTYTAFKDGTTVTSDWTVNGTEKNETPSIIFNRNWWDVPGWFITSAETPKPGVYTVHAHESGNETLADSGEMTIVGVKSISGGGKTSEKELDLGITETIVVEAGSTQKVLLQANPDPEGAEWPYAKPTWSATCGFWCLLGEHLQGDHDGSATVEVDTSSPADVMVTATCGTSHKCIRVIGYAFSLMVSKASLTLKHDALAEIEVTGEPRSAFTTTPDIEIRRIPLFDVPGTGWMTLFGQSWGTSWHARAAGQMKLRARACILGVEKITQEVGVVVQFPAYGQIVEDSLVSTRMVACWNETLHDCTPVPNRARELGFWILLNTQGTEAYSISDPLIRGEWADGNDPDQILSINLGKRPASKQSEVPPNSSGALYAVASFHTHTPTTYAVVAHVTGPSKIGRTDQYQDLQDNVAGIVYDYTISPQVPVGHPEESPAELYMSRERRELVLE
jgi:hypothetical protein